MASRYDTLVRWLGQLPVTVTFCALLGIAELDYASLPVSTADRWAQWASTNVDRLGSNPLGTLVASPFIVLEDQVAWLLLAALGLGIAEARAGWRWMLLLVPVSHLLGTLVSEGLVWWRERHGDLPASALHQIDVGPSYIVVGALTAAALVGLPWYLRLLPAVALAVLSPELLDGLADYEVAAVGHVTAFAAGGIVGAGWLVVNRRRLRNRWFRPI